METTDDISISLATKIRYVLVIFMEIYILPIFAYISNFVKNILIFILQTNTISVYIYQHPTPTDKHIEYLGTFKYSEKKTLLQLRAQLYSEYGFYDLNGVFIKLVHLKYDTPVLMTSYYLEHMTSPDIKLSEYFLKNVDELSVDKFPIITLAKIKFNSPEMPMFKSDVEMPILDIFNNIIFPNINRLTTALPQIDPKSCLLINIDWRVIMTFFPWNDAFSVILYDSEFIKYEINLEDVFVKNN